MSPLCRGFRQEKYRQIVRRFGVCAPARPPFFGSKPQIRVYPGVSVALSRVCRACPWPHSSAKMTKAAMEKTTTETSIAVIGSMNQRLVKSIATADVPVDASEA
jgi:hypothetical protein